MNTLKKKLIVAFIAAGLSAPAAYVGYDLTLQSEGLVLAPYSDPVGLTTYCAGHLATKKDVLKKSYTEKECMTIFAKDFKKHQDETDKMVDGKYASEWQRGALTDMTFNNGPSLIEKSIMISLVKQGKHVEACDQLIRWVYAKGKKLGGLVKRREKTLPYCLGELSYDKQKDYEEFLKEYQYEVEKAKAN
jgi:lysozyme